MQVTWPDGGRIFSETCVWRAGLRLRVVMETWFGWQTSPCCCQVGPYCSCVVRTHSVDPQAHRWRPYSCLTIFTLRGGFMLCCREHRHWVNKELICYCFIFLEWYFIYNTFHTPSHARIAIFHVDNYLLWSYDFFCVCLTFSNIPYILSTLYCVHAIICHTAFLSAQRTGARAELVPLCAGSRVDFESEIERIENRFWGVTPFSALTSTFWATCVWLHRPKSV